MRFRYLTCLLITLLFFSVNTRAQQPGIDSARSLSEVVVTTVDQKGRSMAGASTRLRKPPAIIHNKTTLVNIMNTVAGMRFEERSPGSYRINIRGSSLRSPFGVRNVKVYWNDIPFTDPGGNTYFNQFALNNISGITIYKGPSSSLYGQGTGGVITIDNDLSLKNSGIEYIAGSYNYHTVLANAVWGKDNAGLSAVTFAHNQGDGYREHSKMRRDNVSWTSQINLNDKHRLNASLLYSDMYYQTPGGLTLKEFNENSRASRPAVGRFPSVKDVGAAIWQKTFTAGVTHQNAISDLLTHRTTVYGAFAQVKNSAVRNFERRNEPHFGLRSMLSYKKKLGEVDQHTFNWDNGIEFQQGYFNTQVANNKAGAPDTLQTNDDINSTVYYILSNANLSLNNSWIFTAGASFNKSKLLFTRLSEYPVRRQIFNYKNEFAPRLAVMRRFAGDWSLAANVSKGFSPPTIAELLPSTGVITPLNAEHGWNYEMILRKYRLPTNIDFEVSGYIFKLTDALVQRRDESGADFFVNAGEVNQKGVEAFITQIVDSRTEAGLFDYFQQRLSYTLSHFKYANFVKGGDDFSGKKVPGIPEHCVSWLGNIYLTNGLQAGLSYYYASKIFMNDANSEATDPYYLLGARLGYNFSISKKINLNIYTGADNLLDQIYSLGNDINAAAGRYYNVASGRNYYAGIALQLNRNNTGTVK